MYEKREEWGFASPMKGGGLAEQLFIIGCSLKFGINQSPVIEIAIVCELAIPKKCKI
jgi:hypothetical protein